MKSLNLTGLKFNRLSAIERVANDPKTAQTRWLFVCDCGTKKILHGHNVYNGRIKSCGCLGRDTPSHLKHGMSRTREHQTWLSMRQRCLNKSCKAYPDYGGRGISICAEWDDFAMFLMDMGPRPAGHTLDRIDNEKGYSPENCRWAKPAVQVRNRRTTTICEHNGKSKSLQEWAEELNIPYQTIWHRHKIGKRGDELFSPVVRGGGRRSR